jgi:hypothetical protein
MPWAAAWLVAPASTVECGPSAICKASGTAGRQLRWRKSCLVVMHWSYPGCPIRRANAQYCSTTAWHTMLALGADNHQDHRQLEHWWARLLQANQRGHALMQGDSNTIHRKSVVPFVPCRSERLASVLQPDRSKLEHALCHTRCLHLTTLLPTAAACRCA